LRYCNGDLPDEPGAEVVIPRLELLLTANVKLGPIQKVGDTPSGVLRMIPILGGTFHGPRLHGEVVAGGADWPVKRDDRVTVIRADYALRTHDGVLIRVLNVGLGVPPSLCTGRTYVRTNPRMEAPVGAYNWINHAVLLGTLNAPGGAEDEVVIRFFEVV
jgi:hypothetical protein